MLLDIGSVLGGLGLAVVAFVVVILVCVVILRLLAAILPSYEARRTPPAAEAPIPGGGDAEAANEAGSRDATPTGRASEAPVADPAEPGAIGPVPTNHQAADRGGLALRARTGLTFISDPL